MTPGHWVVIGAVLGAGLVALLYEAVVRLRDAKRYARGLEECRAANRRVQHALDVSQRSATHWNRQYWRVRGDLTRLQQAHQHGKGSGA